MTNDSVKIYVDQLGKVIVSLPMANKLRKLGRLTYAPNHRSIQIPINRNTTVRRFIDYELLQQVKGIHSIQVQ